jgi:hypothetical protein
VLIKQSVPTHIPGEKEFGLRNTLKNTKSTGLLSSCYMTLQINEKPAQLFDIYVSFKGLAGRELTVCGIE